LTVPKTFISLIHTSVLRLGRGYRRFRPVSSLFLPLPGAGRGSSGSFWFPRRSIHQFDIQRQRAHFLICDVERSQTGSNVFAADDCL
jgi:hypothetical protein